MLTRISCTPPALAGYGAGLHGPWQTPAQALTTEQALAMADGDNNSRIAAMQDAVATGEAARRGRLFECAAQW